MSTSQPVPASPLLPASSSGCPSSVTASEQACQQRALGSHPHMRRGLIGAVALMGSVTGLFIGLGTSPSASAAQSVADTSSIGQFASLGEGSNAGSGAVARSSGTGGSVFRSSFTLSSFTLSSFTLSTSAGQDVRGDEESSPMHRRRTSSTLENAVTNGGRVLTFGTVGPTTIEATRVLVQTSGGGPEPSVAATVVASQETGTQSSKALRQISGRCGQASGTSVSGATAHKASEAVFAAYPSGFSTLVSS